MIGIKKIFAVALAASMVLGVAACGNDTPAPSSSNGAENESKVNTSSESSEATEEDSKEKGKTTLLTFRSKVKTFNPHEYQTGDEGYVYAQCSNMFYDFKANEAKDNFEIYPSAAAEFPEDVTVEYAGKPEWGIPEGETEGYAYKVKLRDDLCWDDGTPIKAEDFVESLKRLLDPQMKNYRASDCYDRDIAMVNAENYYYNGTEGREKVTWDQVGFKATGEYELTYILARPCTKFYFMYNCKVNPVKLDIYDAGKKEAGDIVKTNYGTSVDTFASWGPFKLVEYQENKLERYEKNDNWFGWNDESYVGWVPDYDAIEGQVVEEHATQMQLFLQGKSDEIALNAQDIQIYGSSDYLLLEPTTYTTKFSFNTNYDKLKAMETDGICKTMPTYIEFRKAFSRMVNRKEYCQSLTASNVPGFGLINDLYLSDPELGILYRNTERAQEALLAVYGGEDAKSITGYNPEEARELFQQAYEKAKADGNYKDGDKVEIKFMMASDDEQSQKIINFLQSAIDTATEGTGLEGMCKFELVADPDFYGKAATGDFEVIFSTWGGGPMNPYILTNIYCNDRKLDEFGFVPSETMLKGTVDGEEYEMTYTQWSEELLKGRWANADAAVRGEVLAVIEEGLLLQYRAIPLFYRTNGRLTSHRTTYECDEYINNIGFGKQFINMDDEEWANHLQDSNFKLEY